MRVLYVEDNPTNVFLVKRVAKMGNHEVINYVDGSEALRKYDDIHPDIVLMDVQLSGEARYHFSAPVSVGVKYRNNDDFDYWGVDVRYDF